MLCSRLEIVKVWENAADIINSVQTLNDNGVALCSVDEGIDSSKSAGKLLISVLSSVAEIERGNINLQTMAGRKQKAREGKWNGGVAPYGYKLVEGKLQVAEEKAETIRLIYEIFLKTNLGVNGITAYLNSMGIKKKISQSQKLDYFTTGFVRNVLDNPVYLWTHCNGTDKRRAET